MINLSLLATLSLSNLSFLTTAQVIAPNPDIPNGYRVGFATRDSEPPGQQSICTNVCPMANPFPSTSGPTQIPVGVFAGAINSTAVNSILNAGSDDCAACGTCYSIISSGMPYCPPDGSVPNCPVPTGRIEQDGPSQIKVAITNQCPNCDEVPGHFDINHSPGWDNSKIYWKQITNEECM